MAGGSKGQDLDAWLTPFLAAMGRKTRRTWAPLYLRGLLGPGDRKSLQPMAARLGLPGHDQLQHFIASPAWDDAPLWSELGRQADRLVGGADACLVIDDTALPKKGTLSVGVARQYCGALGKKANCQSMVSLTLAQGEVPVPVALRLFLPEAWVADPKRCAQAGVPEAAVVPRSKGEIALSELNRLQSEGLRFGTVLADAGYGGSAAFRHGLDERGLRWAVGIASNQKVYDVDVQLVPPTGRARKPVPDRDPCEAEVVLVALPWRRVTWRDADLLKQEAGIRRGGRALERPVKHLSLNWHPGERPSRAQMIKAVESYLAHMSWQEHQAVLVCHTDKAHPHVHVMLNALHPETGRKLDDGLEKHRSQQWASGYEQASGRIFCPQRLTPVAQRESALPRPIWMAMKEGEARLQNAVHGGNVAAPAPAVAGRDWRTLKKRQRNIRTAFFTAGRDDFQVVRATILREVRTEYRGAWRAFYAAKKCDVAPAASREYRGDLIACQQKTLRERRDRACADLRHARRDDYRALLDRQKIERKDFATRRSGASEEGGDMYGATIHPFHADRSLEPIKARGDFHRAATEIGGEASGIRRLQNARPAQSTKRRGLLVRHRSVVCPPLLLSRTMAAFTKASSETMTRRAGTGRAGPVRVLTRWAEAAAMILLRRHTAAIVYAATPAMLRRKRPVLPARRAASHAGYLAAYRHREAEILQRFGLRLAGLELTLPRDQWLAACQALLLEQAHALTAVRMLAAAERVAAIMIAQRVHFGMASRRRRVRRKTRRKIPSRQKPGRSYEIHVQISLAAGLIDDPLQPDQIRFKPSAGKSCLT